MVNNVDDIEKVVPIMYYSEDHDKRRVHSPKLGRVKKNLHKTKTCQELQNEYCNESPLYASLDDTFIQICV